MSTWHLSWGILAILLVYLGLKLISGFGADAGRDEQGFTRDLAARLADALPEGKVKAVGPFLIEVSVPWVRDGGHFTTDELWDYCGRSPHQCEDAKKDWLHQGLASLRRMNSDDRSYIIPAIRTAAEIESARSRAGEDEGAAGPIAGDLWWTLVDNRYRGTTAVSARDLAERNLDNAAALDLAKRNLAGKIRPLSEVATALAPSGVARLLGTNYESARLVLHDEWAPLAHGMTGPLLVAAPTPHIVLYADAGILGAEAALRRRAEEELNRSELRLTTTVLRWTEAGWDAVEP